MAVEVDEAGDFGGEPVETCFPEDPEGSVHNLSAATASSQLSWQRRVFLSLAILGVAGGILFFVSRKMTATEQREEEPELGEIRVPDLEGAAALSAERDARDPDQDEGSKGQGDRQEIKDAPLADPAAELSPSRNEHEEKMSRKARFAEQQEELRIKHALELEEQSLALRRAAMMGAGTVHGFAQAGGSAMVTAESGGDNVVSPLANTLRSLIEARAASGSESVGIGELEQVLQEARQSRGAGDETDPHMNRNKLDFFQHGGAQLGTGRLKKEVQKQSSPYELHMGDVIPGIMISGISSESPGEIVGQVSVDVYDSTNGNHLLIPQGTRIVGTYNATVSKGQARIQIAWVRLRMRNGDQLDLEGMSGVDQLGIAGFHDRVNRHKRD